jgi:hypothetical protein
MIQIQLAGFTLTADEWDGLSDDERSLLLAEVGVDLDALGFPPYDSYELSIGVIDGLALAAP